MAMKMMGKRGLLKRLTIEVLANRPQRPVRRNRQSRNLRRLRPCVGPTDYTATLASLGWSKEDRKSVGGQEPHHSALNVRKTQKCGSMKGMDSSSACQVLIY